LQIHYIPMKESFSFLEDPDGVLERLGGNEAMLVRLLVKFRDSYRNTQDQLHALLVAGEREEAWRIVHSIKGVSANLGIGLLYRCAISLETRMKNGDYLSMQTEIDAFYHEMDRIIEELDRIQIRTNAVKPG